MRDRSDIRSTRRAGRHVRMMLRRDARLALRRNARLLATFLAVYLMMWAALAAVQVALGVPQIQVGVFIGIPLGLLPYFFSKFLAARGLAGRELGAAAEEWTAQELTKLDPRRWVVLHDIPLERSNIDHVVIGPGCIYAVETKWTARDDHERFLNGAAGQAERQAEDLGRALAERSVDRVIIPLLVVWGPGIADRLGYGMKRRRKRVQVVAGLHSDRWRAEMDAACSRFERDWPAIDAVEAIARGTTSTPLPSPGN